MDWTPLTEPGAHLRLTPYYFGADDAAPPKKRRSRNKRTARNRPHASAPTDDSIRIPFAAIAESVLNAVDKAIFERDRKPVARWGTTKTAGSNIASNGSNQAAQNPHPPQNMQRTRSSQRSLHRDDLSS